jgi:hypothetical protein
MILLKSKIPFYYKDHNAISHFHYHKNITKIIFNKVHNKINEFFDTLFFNISYILYNAIKEHILIFTPIKITKFRLNVTKQYD